MPELKTNEELREYAYAVSHDLSAPVRAMVEFSKLLTSEHAYALNSEGKEYLAVIVENGQKMQAMMDGLLQYSRLNTMQKNFSHFDSKLIVQNCLIAISDKIEARNAKVEIADEFPEIYGDMEHISQVFYYLLDNSLKFQKVDNIPEIRISASEDDEFWKFSIVDNGIGILPEYQGKIFKLFTKLHSDEEFLGVGIGLTLAQKVVHRHEGKIFCESDGEKNCTFHFTIAKK